MPIARAPSMSSSTVSPTIAASAGSTSSRSSTARKIEACGFVLPWWNELIPASTSSAWWRANSCTSRAEFETSPMLQAGARGARRAPASDVVVELEVLVPLPAARDLDGARVRRVGSSPPMPRTIRSVKREPDLVVVLELGMAAGGRRAPRRAPPRSGTGRARGRGARRRGRSPPARAPGPAARA